MLENITLDERLFVWRERKSWSQAEAAAYHGTTSRIYGKWERGENTRTDPRTVQVNAEIKPLEQCILLRRRRGWTQLQTALEMEVSICWFKLMEWDERDPTALLSFWGI